MKETTKKAKAELKEKDQKMQEELSQKDDMLKEQQDLIKFANKKCKEAGK